ncbi:MAG: nucleotide exchange factor GrpE [Phycisphaerae bacterium]
MTNKHKHSEDTVKPVAAETPGSQAASAEGPSGTAVPTEAAQPESPTAEESRQDEALAAAIAEANDLRERLLRWQADFDNLRRRSSGEILETRRNADGAFAKDLLAILDHFETALAVDPAKTDAGTLLQGVKITYDELKKVLQRRGITAFDPLGQPFDPNAHEAIAREVNTEKPAMTVVQTFQRGYTLGEKILRPAKVKVSLRE